ncbi:hypothetical protein YQE_07786, partial [Dendroctonus ponderosae]
MGPILWTLRLCGCYRKTRPSAALGAVHLLWKLGNGARNGQHRDHGRQSDPAASKFAATFKRSPEPLRVAGLKSKLKKVFRTSSGPSSDTFSTTRLVTQLTTAALCASSPVFPIEGSVSPMVKSLLRPLTVPRLQITLVNNNGDCPNNNLEDMDKCERSDHEDSNGEAKTVSSNGMVNHSKSEIIKPARSKKKK